MELEFLKAFVLILGVSALAIFALHRLRIPPLVGFILAGVLIGPHGLGLIRDVHEVEVVAEVGVILLLFTIGIEFSLKTLLRMKRAIVFGGGGQVLMSIAAALALTYPFTKALNVSLFLGFLLALSSTAIVLKLLQERGELDSPHGRNMAGILVFQDLCVVPLMLLVPALSGQEEGGAVGVAVAMLKAGGIVAVVLVSARFVVPGLLHQVVHTRSRELFLVTVILMCLGIALLTSRFGLSLALGAFLAGLILSESEYGAQAMADVLPLKDVFMGLFFVSIGMLMDTGYLTAHLPLVGGTVLALFIIKTAAAGGSLLAIGTPPRVALHAGLGIAQIGEFSFILAETGRAGGLITADLFQLFLSAAVVTMALTPLVLAAAPGAAGWLAGRGPLRRLERPDRSVTEEARPRVSGHVIIVGFGFNGRNLATVLKASGIAFVVLEMNPATVLEQRAAGEPIYYGDGTNAHLLERLGIERARILVVAISDAASTRKVVATARRENPHIRIIVRTRYLAEVDDLAALGADEVIPEEFETSVEVFSRVLHSYNVPRNVIDDHIEAVRKDEYRALRTHRLPVKSVGEREMVDHMDSVTYAVKEHAVLAGHTLRDLELRARSGATVMAYQRGEQVVQNPPASYVLREGDVLLLVGTPEDLNRATAYLDSDEFLPAKYH